MKPRTIVAVVLAGILIAGAWRVSAAVLRQTAPQPGSLAEVVAELRLLRASFEERSRQQAIAAAMAAQQARAQPLVNQLAEVRRELDRAAADARAAGQQLYEAQYNYGGSAKGLPDMQRRLQANVNLAAAKEADLRRRETELTQAIEREDAVWESLLTQLQASIRR